MRPNLTRRHAFALVAGTALAAPAIVRSLPALAAASDWKAIEAAAVKEGSLQLYHNLPPANCEQVLGEFRKDYPGIKTSQLFLTSTAIFQRFGTEYPAGRNDANSIIVSWDDPIQEWMTRNYLLQWAPPEASAYPVEDRVDSRYWRIQHIRFAIIYNTDQVKKEEAPQHWSDLFSAKWKGKWGMDAPWRSAPVQQMIGFWEHKLGIKNAAQRAKANDVKFFEGSGGIMQAVIRGDVPVAAELDIPLQGAIASGAPVGFVYPSEGTIYNATGIFVPTRVNDQNVGKVWTNWLLSKRGMTVLQQYGSSPVTRPDAPPPKYVPPTKNLKAVWGPSMLTPAYQKAMLSSWETTFGFK